MHMVYVSTPDDSAPAAAIGPFPSQDAALTWGESNVPDRYTFTVVVMVPPAEADSVIMY